MRRGIALALLSSLAACATAPPVVLAQARLRPPAFVTCDRNHLTSFTGRVVSLERDAAKTTLRMRTDWATDEPFVVAHPGGDATRWFFLDGQPFSPADWTALLPEGRLRDGARATVWVCDDQPNPTVNWEPVRVSSPRRP